MPYAVDNYYPYVYTNPHQKINVTQKDRVFVLGKDIPKEFIINDPRKLNGESSN